MPVTMASLCAPPVTAYPATRGAITKNYTGKAVRAAPNRTMRATHVIQQPRPRGLK
jgi:hypothetical protein